MIIAELWSHLTGTSEISAICSNRIFPTDMPEGAQYPAIVYKLISAPPSITMDAVGFQSWTIRFSCRAEAYSDAAALRKAILDTLCQGPIALTDGTIVQNGFTERLSDEFWSAARVHDCEADIKLQFNFS